jgi:cytochrome c553
MKFGKELPADLITHTIGKIGLLCSVICWSMLATPADSYPQYQAFVEKHSGRTVNCSMCHANDNGPTGNGAGQIGSLTAAELARLNEARAAMQPGQKVDSPILNKFGNQIIKTLGRAKFLQTMSDPGQLVVALGEGSDLDGDGISDSREYLDGTDPLNKFHGDPWLLFRNNLFSYKVHILLAAVSMGFIVYGLKHLYCAFLLFGKPPKQDSIGEQPTDSP